MTKKIICFLLILTILCCAFPVSASASEAGQIRAQIARCYARTLAANGVTDLKGYCGQLAGYMLYFLGVEEYPVPRNGNSMYDFYENQAVTSGGHRVRLYSGKQYSLEGALNAISHDGTRDAYNILIGFQRTISAAGQIYGHALVIHAILDGKVYYTDSFDGMHGQAGEAGCMTIAQFADTYDYWTTFEGAVLFGKSGYMSACQFYESSRYVLLTADTAVTEAICEDPAQATVLRVARSGERMAVTGVMIDPDGRYYYEVTDDGQRAYISAAATESVWVDNTEVVLQNAEVPTALKKSQRFTIQGELQAEHWKIDAVKAFVYDELGECVQEYTSSKLQDVKFNLKTSGLYEGCYELEVTAAVSNYYVQDEQLCVDEEVMVLYSGAFTVGDAELADVATPVARTAEILNGWQLHDGVWHCYNNGAPRTGWFCDLGVDYYLKADGSVTTGWQTIGGKERYFGDTGALRTGWLKRDDHTFYMLKNGVAAMGWQNVDGVNYYFDENGLVTTTGWLQTDKGVAYLTEGGKALTGWNTIDGNRYFFDAAGMLFSQMQTVDGESVLVLLEEAPSIAPIM